MSITFIFIYSHSKFKATHKNTDFETSRLPFCLTPLKILGITLEYPTQYAPYSFRVRIRIKIRVRVRISIRD